MQRVRCFILLFLSSLEIVELDVLLLGGLSLAGAEILDADHALSPLVGRDEDGAVGADAISVGVAPGDLLARDELKINGAALGAELLSDPEER